MKLNELQFAPGARRKKKRIGRGQGSGHGGTAGKGHKGQKARSGGGVRIGFEGGQMPLHRRLPKRGFVNKFAFKVAEVNLRDLNCFEGGSIVDAQVLYRAGLVKGNFDFIKVLGNGKLNHALILKVGRISANAKVKVENIGGRIELV